MAGFNAKHVLLAGAAIAASMIGAPIAHASDADGFHLSGSLRARFETIDGEPRAGFGETDSLFNTRLRVLAEYRTKPLRLVAELYDSRVWGEDATTPVTTGEVNTAELVQLHAALDLGDALGKGTRLNVLAGRTTLNIGSGRLIWSDDYRNTTQGFTGLKADLALPGRVKLMGMYMLPQERLPDDRPGIVHARVAWDKESLAQVLWGGMVGKTFGASRPVTVEASFFHYGEHDSPGRPTRDRSLNTIGLRVIALPAAGHWDAEAEIMGQFGQTATTLGANAPLVPVAASFIHARAGYTFAAKWKPRLSVDFDRASGEGPGNRTFGRFDTLFGQRRLDYAPSGLYNAVTRGNIVSPGVKLEAAPSARLDGFIYYRPMWLADARDAFATTGVRDATGHSGSFAGNQVDADLRWWAMPKRLRLELCATLLAKGRFLREAPNAPPGRTAKYLSANVTAFF